MEIASNTLHILTNGAVSSEMEVIGLIFPNHADSGAVGMQKSPGMLLISSDKYSPKKIQCLKTVGGEIQL